MRACRDLVAIVALVVLSSGCDDDDSGRPPQGDAARRVARENALPGVADWLLDRPAMAGEIEAYASEVSTAAGETVDIRVSLASSGSYRWRLYRMGHYGGAGARLYGQGGPLRGETQASPAFDPATGLVEAGWQTSFSIETQDDDGPWPSGVYLVKLETEGGDQSYATFVLRDDRRDAEVAVQLPTATWQAYNRWGGESLYVSESGLPGDKAVVVSSDRPYHPELGYGAGLFPSKEWPLASWLESRGYDVEYATSQDTGGPDGRVGAHRIFLSVGHDEYATLDALDRLEDALEQGTSLAFLSGNTFYWQVRLEGRHVICYKDRPKDDPLAASDPARVATRFRDVGRPENELVGVLSDGEASDEPTDWVVKQPDHWLYAGTGLAAGDHLPEVVGYEWDHVADNGHGPAGLVVLADSPVGDSVHNATIYEKGDAFVFAAGTIYFATRLAEDERIARLLENALGRAGALSYEP